MPTRSGWSSLNEDSRRVLNLTLGLWRTLAVLRGAMCEARDERGAMGGSGYTKMGSVMPGLDTGFGRLFAALSRPGAALRAWQLMTTAVAIMGVGSNDGPGMVSPCCGLWHSCV